MIGIYVIFGLAMLASAGVSMMLRSKMKKYAEIPMRAGMTGAEVAQKMLHQSGIHDVTIQSVPGKLTDHYNPVNKTVNLSPEVYHGRSITSAAVAAHECGHAVQHARSYTWLTMRSKLVPLVEISSRYMQWILLAGILMIQFSILPLGIGIILFATTTLFSFITLPVEFDASRRALNWIDENGIVTSQQYSQAKDALKWAAMTYVVAAISSLATLLYYISIFMGSRRG
jgi:hypothetical protein